MPSNTPKCCICGHFATHYMERFWVTPGLPQDGQDERWYCSNHDPQENGA